MWNTLIIQREVGIKAKLKKNHTGEQRTVAWQNKLAKHVSNCNSNFWRISIDICLCQLNQSYWSAITIINISFHQKWLISISYRTLIKSAQFDSLVFILHLKMEGKTQIFPSIQVISIISQSKIRMLKLSDTSPKWAGPEACTLAKTEAALEQTAASSSI